MPFLRTRVAAGLHPSQQSWGAVATGLTAAGSTQATALALTADTNFIGTAAASTGVILPNFDAGDDVFIVNGGANALAVYPPLGHTLNAAAANAAVSVPTGKSCRCIRVDATRWYVLVSA